MSTVFSNLFKRTQLKNLGSVEGDSYNLNLSRNYLPNWGPWEVAREVICNAIDADENFIINSDNSNHLRVITKTIPKLTEMFIIGCGSKSEHSNSIGQFGEGLKMAALVATRLGGDNGFAMHTPSQTITFDFENILDINTLVAKISPNDLKSNFVIEINIPDIGSIFQGRILPKTPFGPFRKAIQKTGNVFCKGVFINVFNKESIWDWNFEKLVLNRDRNHVYDNLIIPEMRKWILNNLTKELFQEVILKSNTIENDACSNLNLDNPKKEIVREAFYELYGDHAVLSTGDNFDILARKQGFKIISGFAFGFEYTLKQSGINHSDKVIQSIENLIEIPNEPYIKDIDKLRELGKNWVNNNLSIKIYDKEDGAHGKANLQTRTIWLQESLFKEEDKFCLYATFLHELAHILSQSSDETLEFEETLTNMLGTLALKCL